MFDRAVGRGAFTVATFAGITSIARVTQDAAIAWRFGTGPTADAYYFVANLANWPVAVALSAFTMLVVPLEAQRDRDGTVSAEEFRSELLGAVLFLALALVPLAWWGLRAIAGAPLGGLEPNTSRLAVEGVPAIAGVVPLGVVGSLLAAWLVAAGRHVLALLEALPPLVLVIVVLLLPGPVLFWAATAGVAVQVLAMALRLYSARELPIPAIGFKAARWHGLAGGAALVVIAQLVTSMLPLVDAFFAARLGEGTLATLNFANRLVLGLQGLAGLALQRASLPLISRMAATSPKEVDRSVARWAAYMGALGVVIALAVGVLAEPLVSILFERGRFTAGDRDQVVTLLRWGLLQLAPFLAGVPVITALVASGSRSALALAAVLGLVVKIATSAVLARMLGASGLQIATALTYAVSALAAWVALRRVLRVERA